MNEGYSKRERERKGKIDRWLGETIYLQDLVSVWIWKIKGDRQHSCKYRFEWGEVTGKGSSLACSKVDRHYGLHGTTKAVGKEQPDHVL